MIKTLIKLKIFKFILIGGVSAAYAFKRYCDKKNEMKNKKYKKTLRTLNQCFKYVLNFKIGKKYENIKRVR